MTAPPLVGVLALSCLLAGCGDARSGGDAAAAQGTVLRVGYSEEPPYAFRDTDGRVTGESPEMLRAVAGALGIDSLRWVRLEFEHLIPSLLQGRVDVLAAGMFITPERASKVRFSRPTSCAGAALVARRDDDRIMASMDDVVAHGTAKVAVISGAVEEQALKLLGMPDDRILPVPEVRTGAVAVQSGVADVMAVTMPTAHMAAETDAAGVLVVRGPYDPPPGTEALLSACSALAFRPADQELATATDCALAEFVGTPAHLALLGRFGFSGANFRAKAATAASSTDQGPCGR